MHHRYYPLLFSPLKLGGKYVKNRICCSPQSVPGAYDANGLTQRGFAYYLEKAKGGCGIVTLGERQVLSDFFQKPDADNTAGFRLLTDMIGSYGALSSIALGHKGCEDYVFEAGAHVEGPSGGVKAPFGVIVDEIGEERMDALADAYATACAYCLECGFDMVMIHGGHSWLPAQFLSPLFNKRSDAYGGSLENRARFPLMVLDRIRSRVGRKLLIEYRLSAGEIIEGGIHIDEMVEFSRMLESRVDLIHASVGTPVDPWYYTFTSIYHKNGINLPLSQAIKKAVNIPVAAMGGLNTPEICEKALAQGQADLLCLGRQMLADPHFAKKAEYGNMEEINTCIRCMCCHSAPTPPTYCNCTVNPVAVREYMDADKRIYGRRILVIGGGPAGMTAANRAFGLGAEVILLEKSGSLGGALKFAGKDVYKGDLCRFRDNLIARTLRKDIDVRLNTEATPELIREIGAELVVCAVGAERLIPPIPGIETAVHVADCYEMSPEKLGERVAIVGGGLAGCELAIHLSAKGKRVDIIDMGSELATEAYRMHRPWLLQRLRSAAVCRTNTRCIGISQQGVRATDKDDGEIFIPADTVVYALGMREKSTLVEGLRSGAAHCFIAVGDCRHAGRVKEAVHQGFYAIDMLF